MISAGEVKEVLKPGIQFICGEKYGDEREGCIDKVEHEVEEMTKDLSDGQMYHFHAHMNNINGAIMFDCGAEQGLVMNDYYHAIVETGKKKKKLKVIEKDLFPELAKCVSEYPMNDAKMYEYEKYVPEGEGKEAHYLDLLRYAAKKAGEVDASFKQPSKFPMPPNLIEFMENYEGVADGFFARRAKDLWEEGLSQLPSGKRLEANETIAKNVLDLVQPMADEVKLHEDPDVSDEDKAILDDPEQIKDDLRRTFVADVDKDSYDITFGKYPLTAVVKVFDEEDVSPGVDKQLKKLYAKTVVKFYDKDGLEDHEDKVLPKLVEALHDKGIDDPSEAYSKILKLRVADVEVGDDGKPEKVILKWKEKVEAPNDFGDNSDTKPMDAAKDAVWARVQEKFGDDMPDSDTEREALEIKITKDLEEKIAEKNDDGSEKTALQVAFMYPQDIDMETGEVTLYPEPPKELIDAWQEYSGTDPRDDDAGVGEIAAAESFSNIYYEALDDDKDPQLAANAVSAWSDVIYEEKGHPQPWIHAVSGSKYDSLENGELKVIDRYGKETKSVFTDQGFKIGDNTYLKFKGSNGVGIVGGESVSGNLSVESSLQLGVRGVYGKHVIDGYFGVDAYSFPQLLNNETSAIVSGDAGDKVSFSPLDDDGRGFKLRIGSLFGQYMYKHETKGGLGVTPKLAIGIKSVWPYSAMGEAMPYDTVNGYPLLLAGGGSKAPQIEFGTGISGKESKQAYGSDKPNWSVTPKLRFRSAKAGLEYDADTKQMETELFDGFGIDPSLEARFNFCGMAGVDAADCTLVLGIEYQHAQNYDKPYGEGDATSDLVAFSSAILLRLDEHFGWNFGGGIGKLWQNDEHLPSEMIHWQAGTTMYAPFELKNGWLITPSAGFSIAEKFGEMQYKGGETVDDPDVTDPDDPASDCPEDDIFGDCETGNTVTPADNGPNGDVPNIDDWFFYGHRRINVPLALSFRPPNLHDQLEFGLKGYISVLSDKEFGGNNVLGGGQLFLEFNF